MAIEYMTMPTYTLEITADEQAVTGVRRVDEAGPAHTSRAALLQDCRCNQRARRLSRRYGRRCGRSRMARRAATRTLPQLSESPQPRAPLAGRSAKIPFCFLSPATA